MEDQQGPSRRFIMIDYQAGQRGLLQIVKGGRTKSVGDVTEGEFTVRCEIGPRRATAKI